MQRKIWTLTGMAVAVTALLAGGIALGTLIEGSPTSAAPAAAEASVVAVEPTRILDSRAGTDVGLTGRFTAGSSRKLQVTGLIETYSYATGTTTDQIIVPATATGVLLNVTAVDPTSRGNLAIRPGDASGQPSTSNLNFLPGDRVPNAVTVSLPTAGTHAGEIDITYSSASGSTIDVVIDVVGYLDPSGLEELAARVIALENTASTGQGPQGEQGIPGNDGEDGAKGDRGDPGDDGEDGAKGDKGDKGDPGDDGVDGDDGDDGADGDELFDRTIVVNGGGSDTANGTALLAAITATASATASDPWRIVLEPGVFDLGASEAIIPQHVSLVGSGTTTTTVRSNSGSGTIEARGDTTISNLRVEHDGTTLFPSLVTIESGSNTRLQDLDLTTTTSAVDVTGISVRDSVTSAFVTGVRVNVTGVGLSIRGNGAVVRDTEIHSADTNAVFVSPNTDSSVRIENSRLATDASFSSVIGVNTSAGVHTIEIYHSTLYSANGGTLNTASGDTDDQFRMFNSFVEVEDDFDTHASDPGTTTVCAQNSRITPAGVANGLNNVCY